MQNSSVLKLDSYRKPSSILKFQTLPSKRYASNSVMIKQSSLYTNIIRFYEYQRRLAEQKTNQSFDRFLERISEEIKNFLNSTEPNLFVRSDSFVSFFQAFDVKSLTQKIQLILSEELYSRFGVVLVPKIKLTESMNENTDYLFMLVQEWRKTKIRSLFLSQHLEIWSHALLNEGLNRIISPQPLASVLEHLNLTEHFLQSLGIDSLDQQRTLEYETHKRLDGIIKSLEIRILNEIKSQSAHTFYTLHDQLIDKHYEMKLHAVELVYIPFENSLSLQSRA